MYFTNITNPELCSLPKPYVPNFSIKLSDILDNNFLFKVEEIVTDTIYRVYPMFNCRTIESTNPLDKIFGNRLIICTVLTDETYITFRSNDGDVVDYSSYGTYYEIEDSLSTAEFNSIVDLIRANTVINEPVHIQTDTIHLDYCDLDFQFTGLVLDNGIEITDLTRLQCRLSNINLHYSSYTLHLKALRINNTNVEADDSTDNKTIIPLNITLTDSVWVDIPTTDLQTGDIILYNGDLTISFDVPVIPNIPKQIRLSSNKDIIQTGEKADIKAEVFDIGSIPVGANHDIYFYEKIEALLTLFADNPVIQTGDKCNIKCKAVDEDGSLAIGQRIDFYEEFTPAVDLSALNPVIQSGDKCNIQAKVTDTADGSLVAGVRVDFYEEFNPTITVDCSNPVIQSGDKADVTAKVKDEDGSLVSDEVVYFYEKIED